MTLSPLRLYLDPITTSCRPLAALAYALETDVPIERIDLSLLRGEHRNPAFREISPGSKVPVLVVGDFILTEGSAIARHLCELAGSQLAGRTLRERARVDEALSWIASSLTPPFCHGLVYPRLLPQFRWADPVVADAAEERARAEVESALNWLEKQVLVRTGFLAGDQLTIADFFAMGVLGLGDLIGFNLDPWPNVGDWMKRVREAPAWARLEAELQAQTTTTGAGG